MIGRRLRVACGFLAVAIIFTWVYVWAESGGPKSRSRLPDIEGRSGPDSKDIPLLEHLTASKFSDHPLLTYQSSNGDHYFALLIKPQMESPPQRSRDYLVIVDTSASQAVDGALGKAQRLVNGLVELVAKTPSQDRIAIWTANVKPKDLTRGLVSPAQARQALKALNTETPLGDTDLPAALNSALASLDEAAGRQRIILFLGDGMSIHNPMGEGDLHRLSEAMIKQQVAFFPVPLGPHLDAKVLHGLACRTGGAPIRLLAGDLLNAWLPRMEQTLSAPVLYPKEFHLSADVIEHYPTHSLPPLRSDAPTLVVGRYKPCTTLTYTITGALAGKEVRVVKQEKMPEAELDNFFLVSTVRQWQSAKEEPALLRGDRALAFAYEQNQLVRADLLTQAGWALRESKLAAAARLFEQVHQIDPTNADAKLGLDLVRKLNGGQLTREQVREQLRPKPTDKVVRIRSGKRRDELLAQKDNPAAEAAAPPNAGAPPEPVPAPPVEGQRLLDEVRRRQAVEEQKTTRMVDEVIREAQQALPRDPDAARDALKQALEDVRNHAELTERARRTLGMRLEGALRAVERDGQRFKVAQQEAKERAMMLSVVKEREKIRESMEERIKARMRVFHNLMNEAREMEASEVAQELRQELIHQGAPVPPSVVASYMQGLAGSHLREQRELRRIRQERYLMTLMQVERSHIPFPDEPPIQFPPAAAWNALSEMRVKKYQSSNFGMDTPQRTLQLRDQLNKSVDFARFDDPKTTLAEMLELLADRYNLTFEVDEASFQAAGVQDIMNQPVATKPLSALRGVALQTVLFKILSRVAEGQATFVIWRDVVWITTKKVALSEKMVRAYPVADLVIPIPNSVNYQMVRASGSLMGLLGTQGGLYLGGLGAMGLMGGLGMLGMGGLGMGGALGIAGALGAGALGMGGMVGNAGLMGAGGALGAAGALGQLGAQGARGINLGVGGGAMSMGGGQLGQFGNLGGQFGLQGGNQSTILIQLIQQVVGTPRDWAPLGAFQAVDVPQVPGQQDQPDANPEGNNIGFYPPAMALVVKGTSLVHTRRVPPTTSAGAPGGLGPMGALDRAREGAVARIEPGQRRPRPVRVANAGAERDDDLNQRLRRAVGKEVPGKKPAVLAELDAKKIWEDALTKAGSHPGLTIAVADYLALNRKFEHVMEFLRANLRQGIVVRPWVFEALALALRETKASSEEIERAEVSAADLEPLNAQGFLRAAQAMNNLQRYDRALALCRQAALLEPNVPHPYRDALVYANLTKDSTSMEWAAGTLLGRDWPVDNQDLHTAATDHVNQLAEMLLKNNHPHAAEKMRTVIQRQAQRDLVIELMWSGQADLNLRVQEPPGSICSWLNRQTVGGGTLLGDTVSDPTKESYVAAEAFPGEYQVTVQRFWGNPLGGKAQLRITQHQGTAREKVQLTTIDLASSAPIKFTLSGSRRSEAAYVAPPGAMKRKEKPADDSGPDRVLNLIRDLSDPDMQGGTTGFSGNVGSVGSLRTWSPLDRERQRAADSASRLANRGSGERLTYQTKVSANAAAGANLTAQAVIDPGRRYVRVSLSPMFNTVTSGQLQPVVNNPLIPGGARPPGFR